MKKCCVIIGAAPCDSLEFISSEILKNAFVIAADGGYKTAMAAGITVDAFVGDLDSNGIAPDCADTTILPCEKDFSDVHTAVNRAINDGYKELYLIGCTNGRADHYFANVALLEMIASSGAQGVLCDKCNRIRFVSAGTYQFPKAAKYFSLLALDEKITGVTLKGLKYPLDGATVYRDKPIGISNEWVADCATVEIEEGRALLIFSEDDMI